MRKIAITLSKGGVGKSTGAVSIAHGLALKGRKVLLVDTDDQGQDAFLLGVEPPHGLADVLNEEICPPRRRSFRHGQICGSLRVVKRFPA